MFNIRQIYDDVLPLNKDAIRQVQEMLREHFAAVRPEEIELLAEKLNNPFKQRFRSVLYVAEDRRRVSGFAMLMHEPELKFSYLDFLASDKRLIGRGIGAALYQRVRRDALRLGAEAILFECLPDDPGECPDPAVLRQNVARLRFYERFGVRPIVDTGYEMPVKPGDAGMPYLMFDGLDRGKPLRRDFARRAVRAILERKYAYLCSPDYVRKVVDSFRDDPVHIRPPRYGEREMPPVAPAAGFQERIALVVNEKHDIHHVRERGYVEAPVRIKSILAKLDPTGMFERIDARFHLERHIRAVHAADYLNYLRRACASVPEGKSVYPYVFPVRNGARPPKELSIRAGYYCIDTFTPLNQNAFLAARQAVNCTLTAADQILRGRRLAYALVRPPGHHAERRNFGGFCYFNNAAIAAHYLARLGKVAVVDIDYHHGNGTQDIFYRRDDVLTVSLHGHPNFAYPYFSGFRDERGEESGQGFNLNVPLPERLDGPKYRLALAKALKRVARFEPLFLVVALGLDTAKGDPTGSWSLGSKDIRENGRMLGGLGLPILVVQEGGYRTNTLGINARAFFDGLAQTAFRTW